MPARYRLAVAIAVGIVVAACSAGPGASPGCGCGSAAPGATTVPTTLKVGLGYIPSVQFAPFYLAQQDGYYRDAGLDVTFENKIDPDLITLTGQGAIDISVADGTDVIPAVSQAIPVQYIATLYGTYPSIVFAKAASGIKTAADLKGKKIGIPGKYGSSWIMLQALLKSVGLTPDDVTFVEYPDYGQGVAVQAGAVDAATGFANNEPVQLELSGTHAVVLHVDGVVALPGPGLISSKATLGSKRDAVAAFVAATLRAMTEIAADPKVGLDASVAAVPDLASSRDTQSAILAATIATWSPASGGGAFGTIDHAGWQASITYMQTLGLVPNPVTVDQLVRDDLLPSQN
ncbi:MAG: putative riboflavin transport system substrate-binding protein [Chloroflexota bacterium]|nr:putative riboflavin transport system substrate-binding protein [Chloroflexota bacterium]